MNGPALLATWVRFAAELRAQGLAVRPNAAADVVRALDALGVRARDDVRAAARACLVQRRDDWTRFDRAFDGFFSDARSAAATDAPARPKVAAPGAPIGRSAGAHGEEQPDRPGEPARVTRLGARWSAREDLRRKDFAKWSAEERTQLARLLRGLPLELDTRPSRRTRALPVGRRGAQLDVRRALRDGLRSDASLRLYWRGREERPRRLIAVCDVSGSMAAYARPLLLLAYALRTRLPGLEAFAFATRLTHITPALRARDPDRMLEQVGALARDFSGGTRIGDALRELNERWLRRLAGSRAVVLVLSDGLDRGDPARLDAEVERLARSCHRLLWLSPLLGVPGYRPATRGVRALLPHVDAFLPAHDLASLERLAELLGRVSRAAPRRCAVR